MHNQYEKLDMPDGDLLIVSGDIEVSDRLSQLIRFVNWLKTLNYKKIIVIGGNHDFFIQDNYAICKELFDENEIIYLENTGIEIDGIKFWGSPITPTYGDWAFMHDRGKRIKRYWDMIPEDTQVLITHGPPYGILDRTDEGVLAGCVDLLNRVEEVKPLYNIFGHIHEGHGTDERFWYENMKDTGKKTTFINASVLDSRYRLKHQPTVIEI